MVLFIKQGRTDSKYKWHFNDDVAFMAELVQHHPMLFIEADGHARNSPEVMTAAFGNSLKLTHRKFIDFHFKGRDDAMTRSDE